MTFISKLGDDTQFSFHANSLFLMKKIHEMSLLSTSSLPVFYPFSIVYIYKLNIW